MQIIVEAPLEAKTVFWEMLVCQISVCYTQNDVNKNLFNVPYAVFPTFTRYLLFVSLHVLEAVDSCS